MADVSKDINVVELLMQIKEDVSSIKTDMANFKESQKTEKENMAKAIEDVRSDCQRDLKDLERTLMSKISSLQSVQNNLVGDVDTLKHSDDSKDAKKWRTVIAFVCTAIGGMIFAKLPDLIKLFLNTN